MSVAASPTDGGKEERRYSEDTPMLSAGGSTFSFHKVGQGWCLWVFVRHRQIHVDV